MPSLVRGVSNEMDQGAFGLPQSVHLTMPTSTAAARLQASSGSPYALAERLTRESWAAAKQATVSPTSTLVHVAPA